MGGGYNFKVWKGSESGDIVETTTHKSSLTGDQVYLKITHTGVCGTDLHYSHQDIVLGHEGIGIVAAIGPDVKDLKEYVQSHLSTDATPQKEEKTTSS